MNSEKKEADEGLDYLNKKEKKKIGWLLLLWFIMPFTAFLKLDEILSGDEDRECPPEADDVSDAPKASEQGPQSH